MPQTNPFLQSPYDDIAQDDPALLPGQQQADRYVPLDAPKQAALPADPSLPAGMRNNNPGNIKYVGQRDAIGPSKNRDQGDPQAVYATPEDGMAAMFRLALRKYSGGKTTANTLIAGQGGWTPGNKQAAANIARTMGLSPDDDLDLTDPAMMQKFGRALMLQEHGPASKAYSDDMIARAVGGVAGAKVQPASFQPGTPSAPQAPQPAQPDTARFVPLSDDDLKTLQSPQPELSRFAPMSEAEVANYAKLNPQPKIEAKAPDLSDQASYLGKSLKAGGYDLLSAGAKLLDAVNPWTLSESDAAVLFKNDPAKLKEYQDHSAAMILSRFAHRMNADAEGAMKEAPKAAQDYYGNKAYATTDPDKAAYLSPVKVISDVVRNLPTMAAMAITTYLTRGAAAQAEKQALAEGLSTEAARRAAVEAGTKAAAKVGAATEGSVGYAQQAEGAHADASKLTDAELAKSPAYQDYLRQGFAPEAARAKVITDTAEESGRIAGIVDAAVNHFGGQFLGKILTEGGKFIPRVMKGAATEAATETVQSGGEQIGQNLAEQQHIDPNKKLTEGVGESMAQGLVVGGVSGGVAAGIGGRGHDGVRPAEQPQLDAQPEAQPQPAAQAEPAPPAAPAQAAPQPAAEQQPAPQPSGPLSAAVEGASEQGERVTVTAPTGEQASGTIVGYQEDEDGNFTAQVQGDDGQVHTLDSRSGVVLAPEEAAPAGPMTSAVDAAAEAHADNPAPMPEPARPVPAKPADPDYNSMSLDDLRARLKYIAGQAKASGGWNKMFVDARKQVERAIKQKTAEAQEASKPAEEPLSTGPFDDRSAANRMMLRHAEATGQPHEVVEQDGKFTIQAIKEQSDAEGRVDATGVRVRDGRADGIEDAAADGADQPAGRQDLQVDGRDGAAAAATADAGTGAVVPGAGAAADAQPALTALQQKALKRIAKGTAHFGTPEKTQAWIDEHGIGDTHEVKQTGAKRFDAVAKAIPEPAAPEAAPSAQPAESAASTPPAQPAADPHAGETFATEGEARAYLKQNRIAKSHTVKQTGRNKFAIVAKDQAGGATLDEAQAKHDRQDEAVRQAAENIAKRKAEKELAGEPVQADQRQETAAADRDAAPGEYQPKDGWRTSLTKAREYAKHLGISTKDKSIYALVDQIDATLADTIENIDVNRIKTTMADPEASAAIMARIEDAVEAQTGRRPSLTEPVAEAEATHEEADTTERATVQAVEASMERAAAKEKVKPSDMRKWLVDQIDKAIAEAPQPDPTITLGKPYTSRGKVEFTGKKGKVGEHGFVLVTVRQVGNGQWTMTATNGAGRMERIHDFKAENTAAARRMAESLLDRAYLDGAKTVIGEIKTVTFDVPGDGKFVAPNTPAELAAFKKRVLASPGFKDSRPASAPKEADETAPGPAAQAEPEQAAEPEPQAEPADELPAPKQRAYASRGGAKPKAEPTDKIADFGEKIGGAKKDIWTGFKDDLNAVADEDIAAQPLSKVWPAPDYQKLVDGGMDAVAVATVRALRDEVPAKPRAAWKVQRWAEQVKTLREFANAIMDGKTSPAELREKMKGIGLLRGVAGRIDLYLEVGHAKSLEGVRFQEHHYSIYRGQENVRLWVVEKDQAASAFSNWPREIATGKTRDEAIAAFKAKYAGLDAEKASKQPSFDIFSERGVKAYFVGKKIGRNYAKLAGPFSTVKEARTYRDENVDALTDKLEKYKEIPRERRDVNEPRVGEDMRNGQDVTPELFADTFKFKGVEFGNWVEQKRRQQDLNDAFDALMDMAAVLDIPPAAISLNGQLGLAFGARGSGGTNPAAAHYEPGKVVINLTKRSGAGSLGHEWWHALDNYFSRLRSKPDQMMTEALDVSLAARGSEFIENTPVRKQMIVAFGDVVRAIKQTAIKARSAKLDAKRTKEYWTTGAEMSARAFESYLIAKLQDQNASNDYLANIVSEETWKAAEALGFELDSSYPYPTAGEIPAIRAAFDRFFQTVETREENGRPVLYSVSGDDGGAPGATRNIPDAIVGVPLGDLSKHPDYAAAKAGDMHAATRATRAVVTPALVQQVRAMAGDSNPIIQPVAAIEATGKNRIPTAAAEWLSAELDLPVGYDIVQSSSPKRTAMAGVDRLFARPRFDGPVEPGRGYILLDDTITQGGTFAALASHIEAGGGHVLGVVALTGKQYSAKIALLDSTLNKVRELYGDIEHHFRAAAGHGFDALTESEARYLATFRPINGIRNRIVARGQQEGRGVGARVDPGREGRQGGVRGASLPPGEAITQLMADQSGEATISRDGIGPITIPYGDKEFGLAHIAARRGDAFMERLPDLLANGEVYTKPGQPDRIFIGNARDEAVIRLDRDGEPGNWLLSAYEKHPQGRQSRAEQPAGPYERLSDREIKNAVTIGPLGSVIARLIEHGTIVIHRSAKTLPKAVNAKAGVQAVTMPDGTMHLVAGALTRGNARAVLLHEMFHGGVRPMLGEKQWADLMGRMGSLYRQAEGSTGRAREVFDRARARVATAKAKGAVPTRMEVEEFAAYAIEEYERAPESLPAAIRKWVEDLIGLVKAYIARRYGKQLGQLTPAQLAGFAKMAVLDMAAERRGEMFGPVGELFSDNGEKTIQVNGKRRPIENSKGQLIADDMNKQLAFYRWFGDSKVVDEQGRPLVVYHATTGDFGEFRENTRGVHFVSPSHEWVGKFLTNENGTTADGANVMPVYVAASNPFDYENKKHVSMVAARASLGAAAISQIKKGSWQRLEDRTLLATIKKLGFDGLYVSEEGVKNLAVFSPEQIKSATGNAGTYDPDNADIRYSVSAAPGTQGANTGTNTPTPSSPGYTPPEQGLLRRIQAQVQDNMNRVKQVQERIMDLTGRTALGKSDYYGAETNRPGRIAARLEDAKDKLFAPLMEKLAKAGKTPEQLEELLHAMHAHERNQAVAKINPDMPDGGSGMKDADANTILARYQNDRTLHALADEARGIARATLDLKHAYGMISDEQRQELIDRYDHYVPLKGDGEYGAKVKRAMGHDARDEHILQNIARDHDQAIAVGEKNLARQSLLRMVLQFADPDLWTVGVPPKGRYVAGKVYDVMKGGQKVATFDSQAEVRGFLEAQGPQAINFHVVDSAGERVAEFTKPLQDNEVMVYVKGDPVRIQIHDEKLAAQLRPLNAGQMNVAFEAMRAVNRFKAAVYTGRNPVFIPKNMLRDAMTGTINMTGNQGAKVAARAWAKYPSAFKALLTWAATKHNPGGKVGQYLTEYRMHGGKVGASHMSDLEQQKTKLSRLYEDAYGARGYLRDGKTGKAAWIASRKLVGALAHTIEVANQAAENALRLSLYMTLREEGQSPGTAAQAAKTVTVDFDRKGEATGLLGAFYLFINPAIQGTANMAKTLAKGAHREQAWGLLGALALAGAYAAGSGMDDDKERWLGEDWAARTKNLIFYAGDKRFQFPLSQEYSPVYAFGAAIAEMRRGESAAKSGARLLSSFLDAYFPLPNFYNPDSDNPGADMVNAAMPTAIAPHVQSALNRNSFGNEIVPESDFTKFKPDNLKMYRGTKGTVYDKTAQGLAWVGEVLGARPYENDITKVSPETLKHLWRTYTGGLGSFVTDSASLGLLMGDPGQVEVGDVPIVKEFVRAKDSKQLRSRYYDLAREAESAVAEFNEAKKAGDGPAIDALFADRERVRLLSLGKLVQQTSKAAAALADAKVGVNADQKLSSADKRAKLKAIEQEEESLYRSAIGAFK